MAEPYKFPDEIEDNSVDVTIDSGSDIEIEVVDDTPAQDRGRKPLDRDVADPTDEEIESYSDNVKKRIKDLTHARHDERRAKESLMREKEELERLAQHMMAENNKLKQTVNTGNEQYVASVRQIVDSEVDKARRALKEAQESFDNEAIAAASEALMDAKMRAENVKNYRPTPLQVEETVVQTRQQQDRTPQVDEKTLRWQAKNQWFGADGFEEHTSFALGLHQKLVNSGLDPRSDEYFEKIDSRMKSTFPDVFGNEDRPTKSGDSSRRPASVVAPATRSTGARKVQLTQTQMALAKKYGLTPQQYAAEVAKLERSNG